MVLELQQETAQIGFSSLGLSPMVILSVTFPEAEKVLWCMQGPTEDEVMTQLRNVVQSIITEFRSFTDEEKKKV
jgi:hypothetical protein